MALQRPTFKVNVAANQKATRRATIFHNILPDTTVRLRFLPPVNESGAIFTKVLNHFKLKNPEGFGTALSCLAEHGNDEIGTDCYLCKLIKYLKSTKDKSDAKVAEDLYANPSLFAQVLVWDKEEEKYIGPKLIRFSPKTADALIDVMTAQQESGDAFFCDPDEGQDISIKRVGASKFATTYTVLPSGKKEKLDNIFPGWEDKILTDVYAALELKIEDIDGQKKAAYRTFGDVLDWDAIQEAIG